MNILFIHYGFTTKTVSRMRWIVNGALSTLHLNTESTEQHIFGEANVLGPPPPHSLSRPPHADDYYHKNNNDVNQICVTATKDDPFLHYNKLEQ